MNGNVSNAVTNGRLNNDYGSTRSSSSSDHHLNNGKENNGNSMDLSRKLSDDEMVTPSKRFLSEDEKNFSFNNINNSTNIKIATNKGEFFKRSNFLLYICLVLKRSMVFKF